MSSTSLHLPDNFDDAERFQRLFVVPMIEAMEQKLENMLSPVTAMTKAATGKVDGFEVRIVRLEKDQKHALVGWGVYATIMATVMAAVWGKLTSWIHFK